MSVDIARPEFLPRTQVLYLDAIEESFAMAGVSYTRLQQSLADWTTSRSEVSEGSSDAFVRLQAEMLVDAWSLVDVLNRLRVMVGSMPGLKKSSAGVRSLLNSLAPVETLRNAVQHLYEQVHLIAESGHPIWGNLSWAIPPDGPGDTLKSAAFVPGTLAPVKGIPVVNPVGRSCEYPVGLIELTSAGETISLSDMVAAVLRFAERFERAANAALSEPPADGGRVVFDVDR